VKPGAQAKTKHLLALVLVASSLSHPTPPDNMERRAGISILGISLGGFIVGQIAALLLISLAVSVANYQGTVSHLSKLAEPPWWFTMTSLLGLWLGFALAVLFMQVKFRVFSDAHVFYVRWSDFWFIVLGIGLQLVIGLLYKPFHVGGLNKPENRLFGNAHGFEFALLCVMTGIFAPIMEELFFRGALLKGLRGLFSRLQANVAIVSAVVLDAVLFAGAHGELVEFPGLALVGIVLAGIYVRTRRIVPCILTHAAFNGVAIVVLISQRLGH